MGIYASNHRYRVDLSYLLYHPMRPLVITKAAKYTNELDMPSGENVIVAIACYTGYNQEDSLVMNKTSVERGMGVSTTLKKYSDQITKNTATGLDDIFMKPDRNKVIGMMDSNFYNKLNDKGYVPEETVITNGDVITDIKYNDLLSFHHNHNAKATMAVRSFEWQNPYGVVTLSGSEIINFSEKPVLRSYINAGVYILDLKALGFLKKNEYCDMPTLFERLKISKEKIIEAFSSIGATIDYPDSLPEPKKMELVRDLESKFTLANQKIAAVNLRKFAGQNAFNSFKQKIHSSLTSTPQEIRLYSLARFGPIVFNSIESASDFLSKPNPTFPANSKIAQYEYEVTFSDGSEFSREIKNFNDVVKVNNDILLLVNHFNKLIEK
jgi:hypothetical protein